MEDIQKRIESYVRGELSDVAEDQLWEVYLAEPEWYEYFDTWLHIVATAEEIQGLSRSVNSSSISQ